MTGGSTLDERYFEWLYMLVSRSNRRYPTRYWKLCEELYKTPFYWHVNNDGNRVEDARDLRRDYMHETHDIVPDDWYEMDASVLEVVMAVSGRVAFMTEEDSGRWFWQLIDHLGLSECTDDRWSRATLNKVRTTLVKFVNRSYEPNGHGGLFPLNHPAEDQRDVEIWYQMSAYLLEHMSS